MYDKGGYHTLNPREGDFPANISAALRSSVCANTMNFANALEINNPQMSDWHDESFCQYSLFTGTRNYDWKADTKQIPTAVSDLINQLQALV